MMRVADYIAETLADHGVRHVFLVTGGGAMHLNDAMGRCRRLSYVACHHEQACAMAAESYCRMSGRLAAVNVTSGPGGTNAITGVFGAWTDSMGMIVISGQVKYETTVRSTDLPLRQLGDQELDIVRLVAPITKYAEMVIDPMSIRYHLEKALFLATEGRPGPVWLDIPMDVQSAMINPARLRGFNPKKEGYGKPHTNLTVACAQIIARLRQSKRPVILAGTGVRISGAHREFLKLVEKLGIPVTTAWTHDLIWDDHPCYVGRPGTVGDRAGNFAVQNSDFLLVLGSRLNIRQISYGWRSFARAAYKVIVDIDQAELKKPTVRPDLPIHADVGDVMRSLLKASYEGPTKAHREWLRWCAERKRKYPVVLPGYWRNRKSVNPYCFVEALFHQLPGNEIVACGDGTAAVVSFQAARLKKGQRLFHNSGSAPMGYDLPAAIGASVALGRKRVICLAGDGSIMMNLQELQTIVTQKLPIKIFLLNNQGYHSIRQTQNSYFPDNPVGFDRASGVGLPDFEKIARAFGIPFRRISRHGELQKKIAQSLGRGGPQFCEIILDIAQPFAPKLASRKLADGRMVSSPLEDLAPFLERKEFLENMLIPGIEP